MLELIFRQFAWERELIDSEIVQNISVPYILRDALNRNNIDYE